MACPQLNKLKLFKVCTSNKSQKQNKVQKIKASQWQNIIGWPFRSFSLLHIYDKPTILQLHFEDLYKVCVFKKKDLT